MFFDIDMFDFFGDAGIQSCSPPCPCRAQQPPLSPLDQALALKQVTDYFAWKEHFGVLAEIA